MKITITPTGLGVFLLADDSAATPFMSPALAGGVGGTIVDRGFLARQKRTQQNTPLFRAAYAFLTPRYNWGNGFNFQVLRTFNTVQNCIAFIAFHPDSVPANGEIALSHASASGMIVRYLPNAIVETVECVDHKGVSCKFQYSIAAPNAWQTTP